VTSACELERRTRDFHLSEERDPGGGGGVRGREEEEERLGEDERGGGAEGEVGGWHTGTDVAAYAATYAARATHVRVTSDLS
jgi:hypothetical protein